MPPVNQAQHFGDIHIEGQGQLTINQVVQIAVAEVKTRAFVPGSPYVGLRRFEERNKDFFFGRDRLVGQILQLLLQRNFVLVAGPSGSGKSSVVRAGLIPLVARQFAQGCFRALVLTPDRDPFSSLRAALQSAGVAQSKLTGLDARTADAVKSVLTETRPADERWVLVVDQFEEIFTLCADANHREAFISGLTQLAEIPQSEIKIVAAMRADFFDRFGPYPTFGVLAQQGLQLVLDMESSELRAAIEQPAAKHGVVFEEGLVEQIIADVKGRPGALPLLQYTLDLLWRSDNPADDRTLNTSSYHKIGGVEGALRQRADAIYRSSDPQGKTPRSKDQQELMRQLFLRVVDLTSQGTEARAVSRRASLPDFVRADEQQLIRELADEKLLVTSAQRVDVSGKTQSTVEIAHEALLSAWPLLKGWIGQAREIIYVRNRISADAHRWTEVKANKPEQAGEELWSGTRLQQAIELRNRRDFEMVLGGLTREETEFLNAGMLERTRKEQEERNRQELLHALQLEAERAKVQAEKEQAELEKIQAVAIAERAEKAQAETQARAEIAEHERAVATTKAALRARTIGFLGLLVLTLGVGLILVYGLFRRATSEERAKGVALEETRQVAERETAQRRRAELLMQVERGNRAKLIAQRSANIEALRLGLLAVGPSFMAKTQPPPQSVDGIVSAAQVRGYPLFSAWAHSNSVTAARFSRTGRLAVTASSDDIARIWDTQTGTLLFQLTDHAGWILDARFSPDGKRLITTSGDNTARLWDPRKGLLIARLSGHVQTVLSADFSPDSSRIVTGSSDSTAMIWDSSNGIHLMTLTGHDRSVLNAGFSPDSTLVVTASEDCTSRIWDSGKGTAIRILKGHKGRVLSANFSTDSSKIVTASDDGSARLWDSNNGTTLRILNGHRNAVINALFSLDNSKILTASEDGSARLWDASTGAIIKIFDAHSDALTDASFSPDGSRIITASLDGTARIWDVTSGAERTILKNRNKGIISAQFAPDGNKVITAGADSSVYLWDSISSTALLTLNRHSRWVRYASFSPDGRLILTAGDDGFVRLWDSKIGNKTDVFSAGGVAVLSASFSPSGSRIVTGNSDGITRIFDSSSGKLLHALNGPLTWVVSAFFSPDGSRLITVSDDGIARVWDANHDSVIFNIMIEKAKITDAGFSPDGNLIITGSDDGIARIWDANRNSAILLRSLIGHSGTVYDASFSHDGNRIITASRDGTARIWNTNNASLIVTLSGHEDTVIDANFSIDGTLVATASDDGTARIWDVKTGLLLMTFADHQGVVLSASFSPNGEQVVTAGADGIVYIYSTKLEFYIERACTLLRGHRKEFQDVAEVCKKVGVLPLPPLPPGPTAGDLKPNGVR